MLWWVHLGAHGLSNRVLFGVSSITEREERAELVDVAIACLWVSSLESALQRWNVSYSEFAARPHGSMGAGIGGRNLCTRGALAAIPRTWRTRP